MVRCIFMQMDAIRLFCDVAQYRSVSKAAASHDITQSAASQRVQTLERELGVRLVDRSKRPLELTAAGELYHRGCRGILGRYEKLKRQVIGVAEGNSGAGSGDSRGALRGEVTIAAIYSAGIDLLNRVRAGFENEHPRVSVKISYLQPEAVYDRVRHEQCDLGILSYPDRWRDLASVPLRDETMVVVTRADHPLAGSAGGGAVWAAELGEWSMVSFDPSLPIGRRIRRYLREQGVAVNIVNQFDNIDTIKTFVAETGSAAILPDRTVRREVSAGVLAATPLEPTLVRPVGIVYLRQREQGAPARAFIEYLSKNQASHRREIDPAAVTV